VINIAPLINCKLIEQRVNDVAKKRICLKRQKKAIKCVHVN